MTMEAPWWWAAALPLLAYLWWLSRKSYAQLSPRVRWASLGLRCVVLLLLIAALSRPVLMSLSSRRHLVFLVDTSRSVSAENLRAALDEIDALAKSAGEQSGRVDYTLVAFGKQPRRLGTWEKSWPGLAPQDRELLLHAETLEQLRRKQAALISDGDKQKELEEVTGKIARLEQFEQAVVGERTDLEAALRLAANAGPADAATTIYLWTDGQFNRGDWRGVSLREGTQLHVVQLDRKGPPESAVADVSIPHRVRIHEGFVARVRVVSTAATSGQLSLFRDGYLHRTMDVSLSAGENTIDVDGLSFRQKGFHTVEAVLKSSNDTNLENNRCRTMVVVPGPLRVLYVEKDESQILYLKQALELEGIEVDARPVAGVPRELSELLSFDAFILSNVPADRMSTGQMRMIKSYVEDFGGGFVMLGGEESFGLGGYYGTPVEEILPVKMPIEKDLNRPALALAMVIDKSGSMDGAKIQLAKRAALATAEVVNSRDEVAVVGFDSASRVILELTTASNRGSIESAIAGLNAGGGTFLYPALEDARKQLSSSTARRKHVIVLSDGQTEGQGYGELVQGMAGEGLTVSTVGIGDGADMQLLNAMAQDGGGRSYFTNDFYAIPQIFTREALRASKSMLVEKLVQPSLIAEDVSLKEIPTDELPLLMGYVATSMKPAARTIIVSDDGDPILARWRYGLGSTAAFTSEAKPRWAEDWIDWPDFAKFWSQLIRSLTIGDRGTDLALEVTHAAIDDGVRVTADVRDRAGEFVDNVKLECRLTGETGRFEDLPVEHVAPGLFEAVVERFEYGDPRKLVWTAAVDGREAVPSPYGFVYSYSPEHATLGAGSDELQQLAAAFGGVSMSVGQAELKLTGRRGRRRIAVWPWLLAAAIVLIPPDILCRRLG